MGDWLNSDDLEEISCSDNEKYEEIQHYLHGYCHEWVLDNFEDGDIAIAIIQTNIDNGNSFLLHTFIKRNDEYLDVRGTTNDICDMLEEFDEGEDDKYLEYNSKDDYINFINEFLK